MLDRPEFLSVFHHLQKDKRRKQRRSLKLDKKRRESSKHNYYIISPRAIIKTIIDQPWIFPQGEAMNFYNHSSLGTEAVVLVSLHT